MRTVIAIGSVLRRLLAVVALGVILAGAPAADPPVYRISRDGAATSYLVGTMHSEDPRVTALIDRIVPLIDRVDVVAIEVVPDAVALLAAGAATLLPADQDLRGLIGDRRFAALERVGARLGIPSGVLNRLKPWAVAVTMAMPATGSGRFLDMEIYLRAQKRGRRVVGLESAAEQLAVFDTMDLEVQIAMLDDVIKNADHLPTQLEAVTDAYLSGDPRRLEAVAAAQYQDAGPAVAQWFEQVVLKRRNRRMLERLSVLLADGAALVAVGAMHLGGVDGLVDGLRALGYQVRRHPD